MKPRIRKNEFGSWTCYTRDGQYGVGDTLKKAYENWRKYINTVRSVWKMRL